MKSKLLSGLTSLVLAGGVTACSSTPTKEVSFDTRQDYISRVSQELDKLDVNASPDISKGTLVLEARRELRQLKVAPDAAWDAQKARLENTLAQVRQETN